MQFLNVVILLRVLYRSIHCFANQSVSARQEIKMVWAFPVASFYIFKEANLFIVKQKYLGSLL